MAETVLRCACCGLPWARIVNGCLVVESKHHGEKHANAVPVSELAKMCQEGAPDELRSVPRL